MKTLPFRPAPWTTTRDEAEMVFLPTDPNAKPQTVPMCLIRKAPDRGRQQFIAFRFWGMAGKRPSDYQVWAGYDFPTLDDAVAWCERWQPLQPGMHMADREKA